MNKMSSTTFARYVYTSDEFMKIRGSSSELSEEKKNRIRTIARLYSRVEHIVAILNRLVETNFNQVTQDLLDIEYDFPLVRELINHIFDKVVLELIFANVYCRMCVDLNQKLNMPANEDGIKKIFMFLLIEKCQEEFMKGRINADDRSDDAVKNKKRFLGNVVFIAELYKHGMLPSKVIEYGGFLYFLNRMKKQDFTFVEPLHTLVKTAGAELEERVQDNDTLKNLLDNCYADLHTIMDDPAIEKRDLFFIQDIFEAREKWMKTTPLVVTRSMKLVLVQKKKVTVESVSRLISSSVDEYLQNSDRNEAFVCFDNEVMATPYSHVLMPQMLKYAIDNNLSVKDTEKVASLLCEYPKFKTSDHSSHASAMKELVDILEDVEDATDTVITIFSLFMSMVLGTLNCCITAKFIDCLLELKDRSPFCSSKEKKKYGASALYFACTMNMAKKRNLKEAKLIVNKAEKFAGLFNDEKQRKEVCEMYDVSDLICTTKH